MTVDSTGEPKPKPNDRVCAAFFDMDNTLLRVDSGMSWVRFLYRRGELPPRMVAKALYWQALYRLAMLDMDAVFTRLVEDLRGDSEAEMIAKCEIWYRDHVAPEVAPAARVALEHHRRAGHVIVLKEGRIEDEGALGELLARSQEMQQRVTQKTPKPVHDLEVGVYQIGEVHARSCPVRGTTPGGGTPAFTACMRVQRGVGISRTRA